MYNHLKVGGKPQNRKHDANTVWEPKNLNASTLARTLRSVSSSDKPGANGSGVDAHAVNRFFSGTGGGGIELVGLGNRALGDGVVIGDCCVTPPPAVVDELVVGESNTVPATDSCESSGGSLGSLVAVLPSLPYGSTDASGDGASAAEAEAGSGAEGFSVQVFSRI